jgi:RNA polymerase sigma factor (sigma-70 family)
LNFEEVYDANKNRVYNLALQYVQNTEDAEDITQEVFVTIHQSFHTFKQESSISTWIYRIAINKSLDFIKTKNRKKRFGLIRSFFNKDNDQISYDFPHFNHPGVQLEDKEALHILFKHINELPENQKTALILHKIEQKTQVEVAEIMNLSAKAVESLIQRAKANLSQKIKANEG